MSKIITGLKLEKEGDYKRLHDFLMESFKGLSFPVEAVEIPRFDSDNRPLLALPNGKTIAQTFLKFKEP